jgi:dihydroorotate dehydrogenase (NAD+) catalytic subunit
VQGVELLPPPEIDAPRLSALVRAAEKACELPLWVKLPLANAAVLAPAACEAGAVGLVVGQAPPASAGSVQGPLYGPLIFPLMLAALREVAALGLPAALIACGGIHTAEHLRQSLAGGASAVQIDSAVWVEPGLPGRLAGQLATRSAGG